jgi:hypothetical protein
VRVAVRTAKIDPSGLLVTCSDFPGSVSFLLVVSLPLSLLCSGSHCRRLEMLDFPQHARMMALIDTRIDHRNYSVAGMVEADGGYRT